MPDKTILVLGGGIGGIVAARLLRKKLARAHRVILVERAEQQVFAPSLLWLMTGNRKAEQITRPVADVENHGIDLVRGDIKRIDPDRRSVHVNGREIVADYMIIALGAELAPDASPGLSAAGHNFYALAGAQSLNAARREFSRGRLVVLVSGTPFKCPAAPYEAAMLLEADLRRRGVRERVSVDIYTPEPGPMPTAGPEVSSQMRQMVEGKGIGYHPNHAVAKIDHASKLIHFANGTSATFDLLAYVPPHRAPAAVREAALTGESGWVPVNRQTLETKFPGVYAIGDVTGITLANGRPLPKAGVFAHHEAEVVAHNIARAVTGKGAQREFLGHGACFVEIGDGRAGFGGGDFFADPAPQVKLKPPSLWLHLGKVLYEKYWLYRWF